MERAKLHYRWRTRRDVYDALAISLKTSPREQCQGKISKHDGDGKASHCS